MTKKFPFIRVSMFFICLIATFFTGCAGQNAKIPEPGGVGMRLSATPSPGTTPPTLTTPGHVVTPPTGKNIGVTPTQDLARMKVDRPSIRMLNDKKKADNVCLHIRNSGEVSKVSAIANGDSVFVGYTCKNDSQDKKAVRNIVIEKVKEIDSSIKNIYVSESPNVINRIDSLLKDIYAGKDANLINSDINEMAKGIAPVFR